MTFAAALLVASSVMAQDAPVLTEGLKAKNAGNDAYNAKDYVTAIEHYTKYLNCGEEGVADDLYTLNLYEMSFYYAGNIFVQEKNYAKAYEYYQKFQDLNRSDTPHDGRFLYSFATTCAKVDKDEQSKDLYKKCIALDYQTEACYYALVQNFRKAGEVDSTKAYVATAMEKFPNGKYYGKLLLMYQTQELKEAVVPFNEAAQWSKKAGEAGNDVKAYAANMEKACALYKQAIPMFEEVMKYEGVDDKTKENVEKAKANITVCKESISRFDSYRKGL